MTTTKILQKKTTSTKNKTEQQKIQQRHTKTKQNIPTK